VRHPLIAGSNCAAAKAAASIVGVGKVLVADAPYYAMVAENLAPWWLGTPPKIIRMCFRALPRLVKPAATRGRHAGCDADFGHRRG
jgi:hypothetical protein